MKVPDERIIAELLFQSTNAAAARAVGLTEQQLYRRMRNPDFKAKLAAVRTSLIDGATTSLQAHMDEAVYTMTSVMRDPSTPAQTRLNAAEAVLRNGLKLSERSDILGRLEALEHDN